MRTIYLANSFSLGMLGEVEEAVISVKALTTKEQVEALKTMLKFEEWVSCIGHESTAQLLSEKFELPIEANRTPITLKDHDLVIVFQLLQRPPEGKVLTKEELEQIPIRIYLVEPVKIKEVKREKV